MHCLRKLWRSVYGKCISAVACSTLIATDLLFDILPLQSFTQLGGLQLDRDVRSLVAAAGELTTKPVRDKFARLTQVSFTECVYGVAWEVVAWGADQLSHMRRGMLPFGGSSTAAQHKPKCSQACTVAH